MDMPNLVRHGLINDFQEGYSSTAINMMYNRIKKTPEEISKMIRDSWNYILTTNNNDYILNHFLYLLAEEVEKMWINDIASAVVEYGLNHSNNEVVDKTIRLVDAWEDKSLANILANKKFEEEWLEEYKNEVLSQYEYFE